MKKALELENLPKIAYRTGVISFANLENGLILFETLKWNDFILFLSASVPYPANVSDLIVAFDSSLIVGRINTLKNNKNMNKNKIILSTKV